MTRVLPRLLPILLIAVLLPAQDSVPKSVAPHLPADWKAGFAHAVITPDKPLWMAGYASRNKPAEGREQDLFAKVLALQDRDGSRFVLITLDLIGVPQALRRRVAETLEQTHHLPPSALLINASHTHSGPQLRAVAPTPQDQANPRILDAWAYTQKLETTLLRLVGEALAGLQPARLTWNQARCGFAMNRRRDFNLPADHPNAKRVPNPDGPVDHAVPALRIEAPDGHLRGVVFGYACHNTCLGFYQWCGDYAGYAQEALQEHRSKFQAMFVTGCGGDQNPYPRRSDIVPGVSDVELARQHGRTLANAVEMAMTVNPRPVNGPLRAAYEEIPLTYTQAERPAHAYPVQVVKFGADLTLIALGSEVVVDYSLRLKRELAGPAGVWVAGYSNDYTGYIPSLRIQREGGYEAAAGWAEDTETRIINKVHELHANLP